MILSLIITTLRCGKTKYYKKTKKWNDTLTQRWTVRSTSSSTSVCIWLRQLTFEKMKYWNFNNSILNKLDSYIHIKRQKWPYHVKWSTLYIWTSFIFEFSFIFKTACFCRCLVKNYAVSNVFPWFARMVPLKLSFSEIKKNRHQFTDTLRTNTRAEFQRSYYKKHFQVLAKCSSKFDCLSKEMLKPELNMQNDSISVKVFI